MAKIDTSTLSKMAKDQGRPYRVLIVDDEKWVQEVFKDFCELTAAVEVELATNGIEAINMARTRPYDLITLDLIMPDMSGLEVLSEFGNMSSRAPVIVITGNATEKLVHQAGVLGACRVLYKPVLLEDFVLEITSAFSH